MLFLLGVIALAAVVGAVIAVVVLAGRQAKEDRSPESEPTDFVAPSSGGRYTWRHVDESTAEFKARAARERAEGK